MTTVQTVAARRVSYQFDTLWDFDSEPTHHELESLYETAKKNQWNGSTAIDWRRPIGQEDAVWRDGIVNSPTIKVFNRFLFTEVLIPRLQRLGLMSSRVEPRYREIGLVD